MKNLILLLFVLTLSFNMSFANVTPVLALISSSSIELSVNHISQKDFFRVSIYDETKEALEFVTADIMNYVQIFDEDGQLKYQLPVMSNKLRISTKIFKTGSYRIGFITKENTTIQYTNLTVNK